MNISAFQKLILHWYEKNKRDFLPWRNTANPYHILVSEIMLHQTQVSRVLQKYPEFLKAFPAVHNLANAELQDILRVWQGMGYNRRALYFEAANTPPLAAGMKRQKTNPSPQGGYLAARREEVHLQNIARDIVKRYNVVKLRSVCRHFASGAARCANKS